jgi:two-component sensor histidine kinase
VTLREKELLLREVHHRVKNNMQVISSLLSLQAHQLKDASSIELFSECRDRIHAMALVHEMFYQSQDLTNVDFKDYVENLVLGLYRSYAANRVKIATKVKVENVSLELTAAIPCGLIINELVTNSLKYAFPGDREGDIDVALRCLSEDEIELVVNDNGIGLPDHFDFRNAATLGLRMITLLAENQLNGVIALEKAQGTRFRITFRKEK